MIRTLGVIPARGGSKGIPKKNIYPLAGLPLIAHTLKAAKASRRLTDCIVSSDDPKIIRVSKKYGGKAPFIRPKGLATDRANSLNVLRHAVQFMEKKQGKSYHYVILLQPTSPLRTAKDIDQCLKLLSQSKADSIISVCQVEDPHPGKMMQIGKGFLKPLMPKWWREGVRRQELPPVFFLNGAIYGVRRDVLMRTNSLWGKKSLPYLMPAERSVNIDSLHDVLLAETLLKKRRA